MPIAIRKKHSVLPGFGLTLGFSTFFLCAIVLIPLAALVMKTATMGWDDLVRTLPSLDVSHPQHQVLAARERYEAFGLRKIDRDRLFDQHVQAGFQAGTGHLVMPLGRNRDDGRIGKANGFAIVGESGAGMLVSDRLGPRSVEIRHRDQPAIAARGELLGVVAAHVAGAEDGDLQ